MQTFDAYAWPASLMEGVRRAGYTEPTPIQAQSWPVALQGYDLISVAKTGSGKTVGYLFPGIIHIQQRGGRGGGPTMIVLAPTRELATQIQEECVKFGRAVGLFSVCLYGGAPKGNQLRELRSGPPIAIATPGRLNDFLEGNQVDLRNSTYVVLDEADRMLDMGFEPQVNESLVCFVWRQLDATRRDLFFFNPRTLTYILTYIVVFRNRSHRRFAKFFNGCRSNARRFSSPRRGRERWCASPPPF